MFLFLPSAPPPFMPSLVRKTLYSTVPNVDSLVHHRRTTFIAAMAIAGYLAMTFAVVTIVLLLCGVPPTISYYIGGWICLAVLMWTSRWLANTNEVMFAFFWGGTIYLADDGGKELGLTTKIGVVDHPAIETAVRVEIPGVLFLSDAYCQAYKPYYDRTERSITKENLMQPFNAARDREIAWEYN